MRSIKTTKPTRSSIKPTKPAKPAKPEKPKQLMSLIEFIIEVLLEAEGPLHKDDITKRVTEKGWIPVGKNPGHVVYTTLHGYIQRKPGEGLVFLGNGMFATETKIERCNLEEEVKEIKTRESKQKKTKLPPEYTSKSCRTCKHLVYNGLQQIQMQFGNCYNESSPKTICKCNDVCDVWEYRGDNQLRNEHTDRTTLKIAVLTFNTGVLKMRSSLSPRIPYEEKK